MTVRPEPPLALLAELTHRCPLRCPYCSNPVALHGRSDELPTAAWLDVLTQAADMGVLQVHFSGGEPTARPDLVDLVRHADGLGLYTNLITSGMLLDDRLMTSLAEAGLQHVQISIQDAEDAAADDIAGLPGAHRRKQEAARRVVKSGLPLTVNAVVHRRNLANLPALIALAEEMGAQRLEVAHVQYYGWAFHNRAALLPGREQVETAIAVVEDAQRRLAGRLAIDHVPPDYHARQPKACMGGWGRKFFNVTPAGRVLPCHAAETIPDLAFEAVGMRPLAWIWEESSAFQRFRGTAWMPEPCRSCDQKEIDWGGCRCQALALTGNAAATDPVCHLAGSDIIRRIVDEPVETGSWIYRQHSKGPAQVG